MKLPVGRQKTRKEFWIDHIQAAEIFDGTLKEYCDVHGLKLGSMSSNRTKLGYSTRGRKVQSRKPRSEFVPVKVSSVSAKPSISKRLPDPIWLAQFLKAWSQD